MNPDNRPRRDFDEAAAEPPPLVYRVAIGVALGAMVLAILFGGGCTELCPTAPTPIVESLGDVHVDSAAGPTEVGQVYSDDAVGRGWVCSCVCDEEWAVAWLEWADAPGDELELPEVVPERTPAVIMVEVQPGALDKTACSLTLSGLSSVTFEVTGG